MTAAEVDLIVYLAVGGLATVGMAPIALAIRPQRHALAAQRLDAQPLRCLLVGLMPAAALVAALAALAVGGHAYGYVALLTLAGSLCGVGVGVCGRMIGARLMPRAAPLQQVLLGTALIAAAAQWPATGIVLLVLALAAGTGGWLLAGSGSQA